MAVEVVGGDVQHGANLGRDGHQFELEAGELQDHQIVWRWISSTWSISGRPMLPPTQDAARRCDGLPSAMRPTRVVVVVFPAEPVMPTTGQGTASMKICESLVSGMPAAQRFGDDGQGERDAAGNADHVDPVEQIERVAAEQPIRTGSPASASSGGSQFFERVLVVEDHRGAACGEIARQSQPLPGCSDDRDALCRSSFLIGLHQCNRDAKHGE